MKKLKPLPENYQLPPAIQPLAVTRDTSIDTATTVTLNANTGLLEVTALTSNIFLKYGSGVTSSDFDEFILAGTTRHYAIPQGVTEISVIEESTGGIIILIEK